MFRILIFIGASCLAFRESRWCAGVLCPELSSCINGACLCDVGYNFVYGRCKPSALCTGVACPENSYCREMNYIGSCLCNDGYIYNAQSKCVCNPATCKDTSTCSAGLCECNKGYFRRAPYHPCTDISCVASELPRVEFASFDSKKDQYFVGEIVAYICKENYRRVDVDSLTCTKNGTWIGQEPSCEEIMCDARRLPRILFASFNPVKTRYSVGDVVTYKCKESHEIVHGDSLTCSNGGTWIGEAPTGCEKISCDASQLPRISFASFNPEKTQYYVGDVVTYTCKENYRLPYGNSMVCWNDGNWRGREAPIVAPCEKISCDARLLPRIDFGSFNPEKTQYFVGDVVTYTCKENYRLEYGDTMTCWNDGFWGTNLPIGPCRKLCDLAELPRFDFASFNPEKTQYFFGDVVTYTCKENYIRVLGDSLICTNNGIWTGNKAPLGPCATEISCYGWGLPRMDFASINPVKTQYSVGDVVTYTCKENYRLAYGDSHSVKCSNDGFWSTSLPIGPCEKISCDAWILPRIDFGSFNPEKPQYFVGDVVTYTCIENYRIVLGDSLTCTDGGIWRTKAPIGPCANHWCDVSELHRFDFASFNPVKTEYFFGDVVTYTCKEENYTIKHGDSLTCSFNKSWVGEAPIGPCARISCDASALPLVNFSFFNPDRAQYFVGDVVTYLCNETFRMVDGDSMTCTNDGSWRGRTPLCESSQ